MSKLLGLLDALFKAKLSAVAGASGSAAAPVRSGPPSFNLLMTTRALHLVPRTQEDFELPLASGEKTALSINSMGERTRPTQIPAALTLLRRQHTRATCSRSQRRSCRHCRRCRAACAPCCSPQAPRVCRM